ncbi:unnamed protein product [Cylicocyclus nassatus]|uniref:Major facilitator superfamily (MFS) profile domain-containing protein n=1 Tax=Cylicocyclus nassatus TaxID=53992 RepID=A0AA36GZD9_CYLNA|nr:unnamed protein product [Cylicocyclus nassatus]
MVKVNAAEMDLKPKSAPTVGGFVYVLAFAAVMGGFLFGYNTGVISAVMLFLPRNVHLAPLNALWIQIITSMTSALAIVGALLSAKGSDSFGRKKTIIAASILFIIGSVGSALSWHKITLLIAQAILGVAIGLASMVVPVYIGEASPSHIRGRLVTGFQLMITVGLVIANIVGGGFSYVDPVNVGWRLMFGCAAIPAVFQLVSFFFLPESPRWLYDHCRQIETEEVLRKIYGGDEEWVKYEMSEIKKGYDQEQANKSDSPVIWRILRTPHVRKALFVGSMLQCFQQLSGINTIMYYTGHIIRSSGVKDEHTTIWISVGTAAVNFLGTFIPMALIERMGRRALFLLSVAGVLIALLAMGTTFVFINKNSAVSLQDESFLNGTVDEIQRRCMAISNCDSCTLTDECGFCQKTGTNEGYCMKTGSVDSGSLAAYGQCSVPEPVGYEWDDHSCKTKLTIVFIILMLFYLLAFSSGYAPLPWVVNAEFYPLWARSTCVSISTMTNWIVNLLISLTFISLSQGLQKYGAYFLYAAFTLVAWLFIYFLLPETRGYSIEEVERLFMSKEERERTGSKKSTIDKIKPAGVTVVQLN